MRPKISWGAIVIGCLVMLVIGRAVLAQESVGKIIGVVRDPSGAAVPGTKITATHLATGESESTVSTSSGDYAFPALPIGEYSVRALISGFKTSERLKVRIVSGVTVNVDFSLEIGSISQTVRVTGAAPLIDTASNSVGTTMPTEQLAKLPLQLTGATRNAYAYLSTDATVYPTNPSGSTLVAGMQVGKTVSAVDGVESSPAVSDYMQDGRWFSPAPELVSEVRLDTDQSSAEYYGSVTYTITTKSGTNQLHGSVYDYLRNTALDARNWFAASTSADKQDEWGLVVGGPVMLPHYDGRNKTFFFLNYGGWRAPATLGGQVATVPTQAMREGNFSELLGAQIGTDAVGRPVLTGEIYDPATTRQLASGAFVRDPFMYNSQLNVIDPTRLSSISKAFQTGYPLPTLPGTQLNWVGVGNPSKLSENKWSLKIDQRIGDKHLLSVTWSEGFEYNEQGAMFGPKIAASNVADVTQKTLRISYFWTIDPNLLLNIRGGPILNPQNQGKLNDGSGTFGATAGLTGVFTPDTPVVSIQNVAGFGFPFSSAGFDIQQETIPVDIGLTWTKGSHNLKIGVSYLHGEFGESANLGTAGNFTFKNLETGQPTFGQSGAGYASFLLGEVDSASLSNKSVSKFQNEKIGFFAQDSWRVTSKLALNYGLRWDVDGPRWDSQDRIGSFDPTVSNPEAGGILGALTFWGKGAARNGRHYLWNTDWKGFSPHFGITYAIRPKMVIRGSYGLSRDAGGMYSGGIPQYGWFGSVSPASLDNGVTPAFDWNNGFPNIFPAFPIFDRGALNGSSLSYIDPSDMRPGRIQSINFGVEREVRGGIVLKANYIGRMAHGYINTQLVELNQLDPKYLSLGSVLLDSVTSPQAAANGIPIPYAGFSGSVAQALRPYPQYQQIPEFLAPDGNSTYNAFTFNVQKQMSHGLVFLLSYADQKMLTNTDQYDVSYWLQYTGYRKQAKGLYTGDEAQQGDEPQSLRLTYFYELPFGPGKHYASAAHGLVKQAVSGWSVGGIQMYVSGTPVTVHTNESVPGGYGSYGGLFANRVPSVAISTGVSCSNYDPHNPSRNSVLNVNAFSDPAAFAFGNTSILPSTRRCGLQNENVSLIKEFPIRESVKCEFGAEFFNLLNRHQWQSQSGDIDTPSSFGHYSAASTPRLIQLHLKVEF